MYRSCALGLGIFISLISAVLEIGDARAAQDPSKVSPDPLSNGSIQQIVPGGSAEQSWALSASKKDLDDFIALFMRLYKLGDVTEFMTLFAARVHTQKGERSAEQLRDEYGEFFLSTVERNFRITDMNWVSRAEGVMGEGDFAVSVVSRRDGKVRKELGALRLVLAKKEDKLLIREIYQALDAPHPAARQTERNQDLKDPD